MIHDRDLPVPVAAHPASDDAQSDVDATACSGIGNDPYRVIWIIGLCRRRIRCRHGKQEQARHIDAPSLHIFPRQTRCRTAITQANSSRVYFVSLMSISLEAAASLARRSSINFSSSAGPRGLPFSLLPARVLQTL